MTQTPLTRCSAAQRKRMKETFVAHLVHGATHEEAAAAIGRCTWTTRHWRKTDPAFAAAVAKVMAARATDDEGALHRMKQKYVESLRRGATHEHAAGAIGRTADTARRWWKADPAFAEAEHRLERLVPGAGGVAPRVEPGDHAALDVPEHLRRQHGAAGEGDQAQEDVGAAAGAQVQDADRQAEEQRRGAEIALGHEQRQAKQHQESDGPQVAQLD